MWRVVNSSSRSGSSPAIGVSEGSPQWWARKLPSPRLPPKQGDVFGRRARHGKEVRDPRLLEPENPSSELYSRETAAFRCKRRVREYGEQNPTSAVTH